MGGNDGGVLSQAAVVFQRAGDYEESIRLMQKAFAMDPYLSTTQPQGVAGVIGGSLLMLHRYREAAPILEDCLGRQPDGSVCWVYPTAAPALDGDIARARAAADELLRIAPQFTLASERARRLQSFRDVAEIDNIIDGLRKAGLPE